MSKSLRKKDSAAAVVLDAAAVQHPAHRLDRIRTFSDEVQAAEENLGWSYIRLGVELLAAKSEQPHGGFLEWLSTTAFPDWSAGSPAGRNFHDSATYKRAARAMTVAENALAAQGIELARAGEIADGIGSNAANHDVAKFVEAAKAQSAGKGIRQLLLPWTVEAEPAGGFRPPEPAVQAWLQEHAPDHVGESYTALPAELQEQFKASWSPKPLKIDRVREAEALTRAFTRQADQYQRTKSWKLLSDDMLASLSLQLGDLLAMVRKVCEVREAKAAKTPKKLK